MLADRKVRRFTVDEYYQMWDTGILARDRRYELIEGEILEMMPPGPEHSGYNDIVANRIKRELHGQFWLRNQNPIRIGLSTEPQPDLAIVRFRPDGYTQSLPTAEDTFLVIEISLSSLDYDLTEKRRLYATAGIPEYWVMNLKARQIHVFTQVEEGDFAVESIFQGNDELKPTKIPGFGVKSSELFV